MTNEIEALKARLEAAERVCVLFGWCGSRSESEREKAALQAWMDWSRLPGVDSNPLDRPDVSAKAVSELARRRDEIRAATLARFGLGEAPDA